MNKPLDYEQVENFQMRTFLACSATPNYVKRLESVANQNGVYYEVYDNDLLLKQTENLFSAVQTYNKLP